MMINMLLMLRPDNDHNDDHNDVHGDHGVEREIFQVEILVCGSPTMDMAQLKKVSFCSCSCSCSSDSVSNLYASGCRLRWL